MAERNLEKGGNQYHNHPCKKQKNKKNKKKTLVVTIDAYLFIYITNVCFILKL